jgi:hypothetical protein
MISLLMAVTLYTQGTATAVPVALQVSVPPPANRVLVRVLIAAPDGRASVATKELLVTTGNARSELHVPPGDYIVTTEAAGFWSPPHPIQVAGGARPAVVAIRMWRTADRALEWTLAPQPPRTVHVQFRGVPESDESTRVPDGLVECPVGERLATCALPIGALDLRVMATAASGLIFTPEYFWSVEHRASQHVPRMKVSFVAGSSVIGYVRDENGKPALGATVELRTPSGRPIEQATSRPSPEEQSIPPDRSVSHLRATTNARGFFQIRQAPPGEYRTTASAKRQLTAQTMVTLQADRETALRDFLSLETPYPVRLTIDPPRNFDGDNWFVSLQRMTPVTGEMHYTAGDDGTAMLEMGRGSYALGVLSGGQKYFMDSFEVDQRPGPLHIKIPLVSVTGTIKLGGTPLAARLTFGGERGKNSVAMDSDERGEFSGTLPREGDWVVQIDAAAPTVHRRLKAVAVTKGDSDRAFVKIDLGDGRLKGRVQDESGRPVGHALVTVTPFDAPEDSLAQFIADETGTFELNGLSPRRTLGLQAETPDRLSSDTVPVILDEGVTETTLIVSRPRRLAGRILAAASSQPVPGATIAAMRSLHRPLSMAPRRTTDIEGRFDVPLASAATSTSVAYWADGYPLHLAEVSSASGEDIVLVLSPAGGTLKVTLSQPLGTDGTVPVIVHRGAAMTPHGLATIGPRREAGLEQLGSPSIVLANLAAGDYALCRTEAKGFQMGQPVWVDPKNCSHGALAPGGELTLALPERDAAAALR